MEMMYVVNQDSYALRAVHLCPDHPGCMLTPGVNKAIERPRASLVVQADEPLHKDLCCIKPKYKRTDKLVCL